MKSIKENHKKYTIGFLPFFLISLSAFLFVLLAIVSFSYFRKRPLDFSNSLDERNYHVLILGNYENRLFLSQVFKGAERISGRYNAIVELYAPQSYAQNESMQNLLDYSAFANADAVIVYNDSTEDLGNIRFPLRKDEKEIPIITLGVYSPQIPQVAYVGNSYSEFGKRTAEEALSMIKNSGHIFLIQGDLGSPNYNSNFMNSFNSVMLHNKTDVELHVLNSLPYEYEVIQNYNLTSNDNVVFIALNESDTIRISQGLSGFSELKPELIGVGNNEVTQNLFNRGNISEIISVDPQQIGELALMELFEYLNKGYANNYITAEVHIMKAGL